MESQTVPSLSGGGVGKKEWTVVMREEKKISKVKEESCPLINPGFTQPQLQELQHQTLIHRHIAAGLPVPFHLVLPIWKSVASSLGSSPFAIFKQFPSFIGISPKGLDYRHVMESDPGRCRRTDGKKWRCSKNVVADQKYCERHIHRGRQRSRKLVEASDVASTSNPTTTMPKKSKVKSPPPPPPPPPPPNPSSSLLGLQLMTPSDNVNRGSSTTTTSNLSNKRVSYVTSPYIAANTNSGTITSAIATNNSSPVLTSTKSSQNVGRYMGEMCYGNASTNKNISVGGNLSPALGFSPRSVLQVVCRNGLGIDIQNGVEREPGRCRRTDGKKWRCRRDVIPDQKYCARHMHRGVKKPAKAIEPTTSSADTNTVPLPLATATATFCRTDRPTPNTNLSISIPTSPPPPTCKDEKSESGNSSDTTITDTTISAYTVGKVPS